MAPALEAVIKNHLESKSSVILEGDFILPALAAQTSFCGYPGDGQVRALIIDEVDEAQLLRNFEERESTSQPLRARGELATRALAQQEAEAAPPSLLLARGRRFSTGSSTPLRRNSGDQ